MECLQGREGHSEEEEEEERHMTVDEMGKYPFQLSQSSSSPSPSSQYKGLYGLWGPLVSEEYERHDHNVPKIPGREVFTNSKHLDLMDLSTNHNHAGDRNSSSIQDSSLEREHMFDKVVTPSDVGKLNRLVIPKQHAEKYFPLNSSANEKGLLLNFEDLTGKVWRFRYSYWNSSQSYVMTKGWSRFVKDKKLDAGDIVSFERGAAESAKDRLYIDWKHRPNAPPLVHLPHPLPLHKSVPWSRILLPQTVPTSVSRTQLHLQQLKYGHRSCSGPYGYNVVNPPGSVFYLRPPGQQQVGGEKQGDEDRNAGPPVVFNSMPVVHSNATEPKRLRLFGVNLECPTAEDADRDVLSSSVIHHTWASSLPPHPLKLFNGGPPLTAPEELPRKGKMSLSLDLDI
ncbi:B3 domain-containing transcription factor NGA1-like [Magnolia sinica]|uniref:B3 domain-containing transcription factor NGA1-like n=1 Tax=Magnolia sinica TaxID=86752 RepID=UPI002658AA61|nr:B3 domain-containing transcription factor NGA1-like [Magnolia sinica]